MNHFCFTIFMIHRYISHVLLMSRRWLQELLTEVGLMSSKPCMESRLWQVNLPFFFFFFGFMAYQLLLVIYLFMESRLWQANLPFFFLFFFFFFFFLFWFYGISTIVGYLFIYLFMESQLWQVNLPSFFFFLFFFFFFFFLVLWHINNCWWIIYESCFCIYIKYKICKYIL